MYEIRTYEGMYMHLSIIYLCVHVLKNSIKCVDMYKRVRVIVRHVCVCAVASVRVCMC